jgi:stress responsive alpha/beta barrel protein
VFRHIALLRWKGDASDDARERACDAIRALPSVVAEIRAYRVGDDAGETAGNYDLAIVADFDDAAGYAAYRDHPAHRRVIDELVRPILDARAAVQHPLDS